MFDVEFCFVCVLFAEISYSRTTVVKKKPCVNLIQGDVSPLLLYSFCIQKLFSSIFRIFFVSFICIFVGMERVKEMSRLLRVRKEVEELSLTYYRQAYEHKTFLNVTLQRKEILGGCCVLASCRQQRWPITLNTVSYLLNDDPAVVGEVYHEMIKVLNIQAPAFSVTDVMEAHCQE